MSEYENLLRQIKSQVPVDESFDLLERKLKIGERDATMFFVDGLVDGDVMQRVVASLQGLDKKTVDRAKTAGEFMAYNLAFLDCLSGFRHETGNTVSVLRIDPAFDRWV